jgi:hypothetical protein
MAGLHFENGLRGGIQLKQKRIILPSIGYGENVVNTL